ncbi:MAG: glycoside hydrolase [Clostridiales bacterium]|nr:glycoside hydrolase [Clostridiales bacterium]
MKRVIRIGITGIFLALVAAVFPGQKAQAAEYKFNMSYIFFSDASSYTSMVDSAQNSLSEISPNYFTLDNDGSLLLNATINADFVSDMHSRGISVVPFLSNEWSRTVGKAALSNREQLSDSLAEAVSLYDLDGVNIDIENMTVNERDIYVDFIRLLRSKLPGGKSLVVSVAANPWGSTTGWQGSYDYAALSEYCDYLMVMTYDEHYYGGPAGPVSSISYVENALKYAVSLVPKEKIVLGLPFYGRIWSDNGRFPNGYGITNARIAQLVKDYGGTVQVDPASQSTYAVMTINPDDPKPVIGGQALDSGTYTIWYESENSIKARLELVNQYGIKGTGNWALGQETGSTWNYYKLWLNNCTFTDIQDTPEKDYILDAYMKNLVNGCGDGRFSPDEPLTRAQAATILVRMLKIKPELNPAYCFDDCIGSWAQSYIETARKYNIITGIGDNRFNPDRPVTREEFAVMINHTLLYRNNGGVSTFSDVSLETNPWSYNAIEALGNYGILSGYPDGTFRPGDTITRAEAAALITRIP